MDTQDIAAEIRRHSVVESYPSEDSTHYVFACLCGGRDIYTITQHIAEMIQKRMTEEAIVSTTMTVKVARIGDLIDHLRSLEAGTEVPFLAYSGDSYRGYYDRFALCPGTGECRSVADYLEQDVIGHTFTGYKGGDYTMTERTLVHCNEYGRCDGADQVGITSDGQIVLIEDAW